MGYKPKINKVKMEAILKEINELDNGFRDKIDYNAPPIKITSKIIENKEYTVFQTFKNNLEKDLTNGK